MNNLHRNSRCFVAILFSSDSEAAKLSVLYFCSPYDVPHPVAIGDNQWAWHLSISCRSTRAAGSNKLLDEAIRVQ